MKDLVQGNGRKIALFCDINKAVIQVVDAETIYEIPLVLEREGLDNIVIERFGLKCNGTDLTEWKAIVDKIKNPIDEIKIALVGVC